MDSTKELSIYPDASLKGKKTHFFRLVPPCRLSVPARWNFPAHRSSNSRLLGTDSGSTNRMPGPEARPRRSRFRPSPGRRGCPFRLQCPPCRLHRHRSSGRAARRAPLRAGSTGASPARPVQACHCRTHPHNPSLLSGGGVARRDHCYVFGGVIVLLRGCGGRSVLRCRFSRLGDPRDPLRTACKTP